MKTRSLGFTGLAVHRILELHLRDVEALLAVEVAELLALRVQYGRRLFGKDHPEAGVTDDSHRPQGACHIGNLELRVDGVLSAMAVHRDQLERRLAVILDPAAVRADECRSRLTQDRREYRITWDVGPAGDVGPCTGIKDDLHLDELLERRVSGHERVLREDELEWIDRHVAFRPGQLGRPLGNLFLRSYSPAMSGFQRIFRGRRFGCSLIRRDTNGSRDVTRRQRSIRGPRSR